MKQMNLPERANRRRESALARLLALKTPTGEQQRDIRVLKSRIADSLRDVRTYKKNSATRTKGGQGKQSAQGDKPRRRR
jgi:hypothetical protein